MAKIRILVLILLIALMSSEAKPFDLDKALTFIASLSSCQDKAVNIGWEMTKAYCATRGGLTPSAYDDFLETNLACCRRQSCSGPDPCKGDFMINETLLLCTN